MGRKVAHAGHSAEGHSGLGSVLREGVFLEKRPCVFLGIGEFGVTPVRVPPDHASVFHSLSTATAIFSTGQHQWRFVEEWGT